MPPSRCGATASSPHSVDETTFRGTPSTNPTSFTPEADTSTKHRAPNTTPRQLNVGTSVSAVGDVFLDAPNPTNDPHLSPPIEVFTPGLHDDFNRATATPPAARLAGLTLTTRPVDPVPVYQVPRDISANGNLGVRPLLKGRTSERNAYGLTQEQPQPVGIIGGPPRLPGLVADDPNILRAELGALDIGDLQVNAFGGIYLHDVRYSEGSFSTDENVTRAFAVIGNPDSFRSSKIATAFKPTTFPSVKTISASQMIHKGLFTVSFADVRDAKKAYDVSSTVLPLARVIPLSPKALAADEGKDPYQVSDFEGQAIVNVYFSSYSTARPMEAAPIVAEIKRLLTQCGDIKAFHTMPTAQNHVREFRIEFYNANHVDIAKDVITGTVIRGAVLGLEPFQPDVRDASQLAENPQEYLSITGRSTVPFDPDYDRLAFVIQRDALQQGRRFNQNGNHNAIDIVRIRLGIDVRTTVMLRNLPNRVNQQMLKAILDITSFGCYDFMYLRIETDFANNCNVGYAFINFIDFALARSGKRWNCFSSDKIAEVSYAAIQGRDCLIQKFRNSSLYIAGHVPNAGQEERFPGPDNHSKMRRSIENAEHVGLYIPRDSGNLTNRRGLRRTGKFIVDDKRRQAFYLPPARTTPKTIENPDDSPSPSRAALPFLVDINSLYDPFSGIPRP
ncbi:uncharacterized protein Z518_01456 [Rhinocladiella mackenziei CBS 650.93]|uniref:RRM domain-containing protein n=1 Tax=Rhinocladiella mackenziei CBS 650.93 TaxID=1442369 RepID=A0A0D2IWJ9_9EURO|nr:uncharacterized protein Z518_01456 [Rhinocladiella mackenziei CBS 650.93]KIX10374.1 hypothetical protein Z518_01456 [Rhinocladiella mackenziei CBS 650.93]